MKKKGKIQNHFAFFLVLSLAILSLVAGILGRRNAAEYRASCTSTTSAEVVRTEMKTVESRRSRHKEYRATIQFRNEQGMIVKTHTQLAANEYRKDSTIEIYYDPADPTCVYVPGRSSNEGAFSWLAVGEGVLIIIFVWLLFKKYLSDTSEV